MLTSLEQEFELSLENAKAKFQEDFLDNTKWQFGLFNSNRDDGYREIETLNRKFVVSLTEGYLSVNCGMETLYEIKLFEEKRQFIFFKKTVPLDHSFLIRFNEIYLYLENERRQEKLSSRLEWLDKQLKKA